jgi:hypothetical protein
MASNAYTTTAHNIVSEIIWLIKNLQKVHEQYCALYPNVMTKRFIKQMMVEL